MTDKPRVEPSVSPIPHWAIGLARKLRAYLKEMESQPPSYAARVEGMARIIAEKCEPRNDR